MMVSVFVQITVKDYEAWKSNFDGAAQFMKELGVVSSSVHCNLNNPNSVMIFQEVSESSLEQYLSILDGAADRRAEEGILSWELWVGKPA